MNSYISTIKRQITQFKKMGKEFEYTFLPKKDTQMANKHLKGRSTSLVIGKGKSKPQ